MRSQNTSTASTRPSSASAGSMRSQTSVDIVVGASGKLGRQRMRAEKGRIDRHRIALAETARDAQHLAFAREIEAIAGFDFDGGHAFGEQRFEPRGRLAEQASSSSAARVARTVETMPPPCRAISS